MVNPIIKLFLPKPKPKKIGLALSGGGALGAAHIAVLEEFEKQKIPVDYIGGTSAGAIIGSLYAAGGMKAVHTFIDEVRHLGLLKKSVLIEKRPSTIFELVRNILEKLLDNASFVQLKKPFRCIATDIATGKPVILSHGLVVPAVLASAAYPGVFPIQKVDEKCLIDGGVTINIPTLEVRKMGAEHVVASCFLGLPKWSENQIEGSRFSHAKIIKRSLDIMQDTLYCSQTESADTVISFPLEDYSWYDFYRLDEIKEQSRATARQAVEKLLSIF